VSDASSVSSNLSETQTSPPCSSNSTLEGYKANLEVRQLQTHINVIETHQRLVDQHHKRALASLAQQRDELQAQVEQQRRAIEQSANQSGVNEALTEEIVFLRDQLAAQNVLFTFSYAFLGSSILIFHLF
jgi:hypothetical protein